MKATYSQCLVLYKSSATLKSSSTMSSHFCIRSSRAISLAEYRVSIAKIQRFFLSKTFCGEKITKKKNMAICKRITIFFVAPPRPHQIGQNVLARSLKIGVTHTCGGGVTHTYGTGLTHTCFGGVFGWSFCTIGDRMRRIARHRQTFQSRSWTECLEGKECMDFHFFHSSLKINPIFPSLIPNLSLPLHPILTKGVLAEAG